MKTPQNQRMIHFTRSLQAWDSPAFQQALKLEIEQLSARQLPLQQGLTKGSYALDGKHKAMLISAADMGEHLRIKAGVFYASVIAGCSCADDPTPVDEENEYCVIQLDIDKGTAETTISLVSD